MVEGLEGKPAHSAIQKLTKIRQMTNNPVKQYLHHLIQKECESNYRQHCRKEFLSIGSQPIV